MKMLALVSCAVLLLVAVTAQGQRPPQGGGIFSDTPLKCGPGENYSSCSSSSCAEATCVKPEVGPICTADCRQGCFCRKGLFRNSQRKCVPRDQCP